jgi:hypothetical protein
VLLRRVYAARQCTAPANHPEIAALGLQLAEAIQVVIGDQASSREQGGARGSGNGGGSGGGVKANSSSASISKSKSSVIAQTVQV